jgi:hypothetical protein
MEGKINIYLPILMEDNQEKNYSWRGSPNAGLVLSILAGLGAVLVILAGFAN